MNSLFQLIKQLPAGKRALMLILIVVILLTWVGVCAILSTYPAVS